MEQNFSNNRGNGYNGQNRNNNVNDNRGEMNIHHAVNNNNQGGMNVRPEVNTGVKSGTSTFNKVAQHLDSNKTVYACGVGAVMAIAGLGILSWKKGWIPGLRKKKAKEPAPAEPAASAEKPAQKPAESK